MNGSERMATINNVDPAQPGAPRHMDSPMIPLPPQDPALEGLQAALDPGIMVEALDRYLTDCASGALRVEACRPYFVRYKPGKTCVVQYKLSLQDPSTGTVIQTLAHARIGHGRRAEKLWSDPKLGRLVERAAREHPFLPVGRVAHIPEIEAVVQLYPVDVELPGMVQAASPSAMRRTLHQELGIEADECAVELVRYRAPRRAVLRCRLRGGPVDAVYCKLQPDNQGAAVLEVSRALGEAGVPTPMPLAFLPSLGMLVYAEAQGVPLGTLRGTAEFGELMGPVAETLARLHRTRLDCLPAYSPDKELESVLKAARMIGTLMPGMKAQAARLAQKVVDHLSSVVAPTVTVHGDFSFNQVLVSDAGVVLLDFDQSRLGNPLLDVGNFLAKMLAYAEDTGRSMETEREKFLDAYLSLRPDAGEHAQLFEAAWLLRRSITPFKELSADWPEAIERRVRVATERLEEYERTQFGTPARSDGRYSPAISPTPPNPVAETVERSTLPLPPPDPALEALPVALDGGAMRELLDKRLPDCASGAFQVESCRPRYVKYKPGASCLVGYKLALRDLESGTTSEALGHVKLYRGGRAEKLWSGESMSRLVERAAREHPHPPLGRAAYLPEMRAIVQLYPVDPELPGLVEAASPDRMLQMFHQALPDGTVTGLRECHVELVRYKLARRAVLRYRLSGANASTLYGKVRSDDRGAELFRVSQALIEAGVSTPPPLTYLPEVRMLVHAEAKGVRLKDHRGTAEFEEWMAPVAETLAHLHGTQLDCLPVYSSQHEAEAVLGAAGMIGRLLPRLETESARIAKGLAGHLGNVAAQTVTLHGGFHDDQALVSDAGVTLLDFDGARLGNPLLDVANFLVHLSDRQDGARASFVEAYLALRPEAREHIPLYEAAWLFRTATRPFHRLRPDWPVQVERRVHVAAKRMTEYEHGLYKRYVTAGPVGSG